MNRLPLALALLLAGAVVVVGFHWNTRVGGGSDSYGYVSQADMWLSGRLTINQPWAAAVALPQSEWFLAPIGYRPRVVVREDRLEDDGTALVPKYSPGLPLLMAIGKRLAGQMGMFAIGPIAGGVLILATFGLGRRLGMPWAGLLAAWLVATSPAFLNHLVQPMSDVPVAAAWTVAFWCLLGTTRASALAAGVVAAIAILIRPNLVPVGLVAGLWLVARAVAERHREWRLHLARTLLFAAGSIPAIVAIAALNRYWYGSPLNSGYEPLHVLFMWSNVAGNIERYTRWFVETQTAFVLLGFAALLVPRLWPTGRLDRPWVVGLFAAVVVVVWGEYFFYTQFDDWSYLRFLLPTWPIVMLGLAAVIAWPPHASHPIYRAVVVALSFGLGWHGVVIAQEKSTFVLRTGESKYVSVARLTRAETGPGVMVLSMQHSGSLRYYGGVATLQWRRLGWSRLDQAVSWFNEHGVHAYALLEEWEVVEFRQRFGADSAIGRLEMRPMVRFDGPSKVFLFDLLKPSTGDLNPVKIIEYQTHLTDWPKPAAPPRVVLR